ncbi:MAG: hypothetical protein IPJ58_12995 [Ardenticatenia bacterium]|nr:hypothetical protein [Ardenticatenia bacterium]
MNHETATPAPGASAATGEVGSALALGAPVMPFGSYAGLALADVARLDPGHLLALVREGIGPVELRAAAAQALARSRLQPDAAPFGGLLTGRPLPLAPSHWERFPEGGGGSREDRAPAHPWVRGLRRIAPWLLGAGLGVAALGVADDRMATVPPFPAARAPATAAASVAAPTGTAEDRAVSAAAGPSPIASALLASVPTASVPTASAPLSAAPTTAALTTAAPPADANAKAAVSAAPSAGSYDPMAPCGSRAAGAIAAADAAAHLDQFSAIEFAVVGAKDTGKVTFLNSHEPYQGHFYVAIFPICTAHSPAPARVLTGRCVVIQGRVESFRGVPQIVLHDAADLRDLGPAGPVPATAPTLPLP